MVVRRHWHRFNSTDEQSCVCRPKAVMGDPLRDASPHSPPPGARPIVTVRSQAVMVAGERVLVLLKLTALAPSATACRPGAARRPELGLT